MTQTRETLFVTVPSSAVAPNIPAVNNEVCTIEAPVKTSSTTDDVTPTNAEYNMKRPAAVAGSSFCTRAER